MELSERKKRILKSIVDSYIASGEPIGSKYLTTSCDFTVSPATIRNEMSELEDMGYLEQPHTSAGRVPTALGFKTYVDSLMEKYLLTMDELKVLNELISFKMTELSDTLEQASKLISKITNYASFAVLQAPERTALRFETVFIDETDFLIVMICDNDAVRSSRVKLREPITKEDLQTLQAAMNASLTGLHAEEITMPVFISFEQSLGGLARMASACVKAVYDMLSGDSKEEVHVDGVTKLLSYPEFSDISSAKSVLYIIEEQSKLIDLLSGAKSDNLNLYIDDGGEAELPVKDTSCVFCPIKVNGKKIGAIGVIGPKRMNYKKVIASLNYLASGISVELDEQSRTELLKGEHNGSGTEQDG